VSDDYEPYVSDPAEPPRRRRLAGAAPLVWTLALVLLLAGATTIYWTGRGEEDPALTVPASENE
jgi:hypothetical protein